MSKSRQLLEELRKYKRANELAAKAAEGDGEFSPAAMVRNIPGSAVNFVKDMTYPIRHPINTFEGMRAAASGAAQKLAAGDSPNPQYANPANVRAAEGVGEAIQQRYGGWDNILNTLEKDPVGLLSDIAMLPSMAAKAPGKVGQVAAKVTAVTDPVSIATNAAKAGVKAGLSKVDDGVMRNMYLDSAKFSTTLPPETRQRMAQTALDEQIMPTYKGTDKLSGKVESLSQSVGKIVDDLTASGESIPKSKLLAKINAEKAKISKVSERGYDKVIKQWDSVIDDYQKQWADVETLTPRQVQDMKLSLDRSLYPPTGTVKAFKPGTQQAEMSARTAAKQTLEEVSPELASQNQRLSRLKELQKGGLERSANRIENRNPIGIDVPLLGGAGTAAGGMPGAVAGAALAVSQAPKPRAWMALAMKRLKDSPMSNVFFTPNGALTPQGRQAMTLLGRLGQQTNPQEGQ